MEEKRDIHMKLSDINATIEKTMGQMTDSFSIRSANMPEFTEEFFLEGIPDFSELAKEIDVENTVRLTRRIGDIDKEI